VNDEHDTQADALRAAIAVAFLTVAATLIVTALIPSGLTCAAVGVSGIIAGPLLGFGTYRRLTNQRR
jgi:hypothetical protein